MLWWLRKSLARILAVIATGFVILQPVSRDDPFTPWITPTRASADNPKPKRQEIRLLTPGERIEQELSSGETHSYQITLNAGQYLHANIEHSSIDIGGAVYGPDGKHLVEFQCRQRGPTPVSLIADVNGTYQLEIRSLEENSVGRYMLRVEGVRSGTAQDKVRVAAEAAFAGGEQLRAEWREESFRNAIKRYEAALQLWKSTGEPQEEAKTLRAMGDVWQALSESRMALKCYTESLFLSRKINDRRGETEASNGIGYVHLSAGDSQKALEYFERALRLSQAQQDRQMRLNLSIISARLTTASAAYRNPLSTINKPSHFGGTSMTAKGKLSRFSTMVILTRT